MNAPFETIVVEDGFGKNGNGDTFVDVVLDVKTRSGFRGDVVALSLATHVPVALTPDEARAIGKALIAAADYLAKPEDMTAFPS